jgi:hypothetical protein
MIYFIIQVSLQQKGGGYAKGIFVLLGNGIAGIRFRNGTK